MPPTFPVITRVVLVLITVLGLAASFLAAAVTNSQLSGAASALWLLAPSAALLAVAWWRKNKVGARPVVVASTFVVAAPLVLWLAFVLLAAATVRGESGLGAVVGLGVLGLALPLIQLSGIAAVGLVSLARPLRDKSAGFLAGVALLLLSAAGVPLYLTGLLGGLGGWLVVTLVEGPSRWQAAAEDARRPPDLEARWEQVHAAQRAWLDADGIVLSDAAGHRFRKRPGWQALQNFVFIGRLQNEAHDVSIPVEGDIVAEGEPAVERTYSGESIFSFHRRDDRRWFLTAVTLKDLSLTSEVSIDLSQFAGVRPLPSRAPANPAVQLTKASAQAALAEWLAARYPLAGEFMKDPGGTVEVLRLRGKEALVRFDKVPYHRWRDAGRHEYSGPGLAQFSGDSAGQWALSGVRLSELTLDRDPAQWSDSPDHGIRVR